MFTVTACGGGGGDSSPAEAPGAPTGVTAVAGAGQARVSWDNVAGATSYNLYYSQTPGVTKSTGREIPNVTSPRVVTPLNNGTTYYFVVTAVNGAGESAESNEVPRRWRSTLRPASYGCHGMRIPPGHIN
jgi:hypothetical protein